MGVTTKLPNMIPFKPGVELTLSFVWFLLVLLRMSFLPGDKTEAEIKLSVAPPKQHFKFQIPIWKSGRTCAFGDTRAVCRECVTKPELWDCVGSDRSWGMVFVDNRPGAMRGPNALRLVKRSE